MSQRKLRPANPIPPISISISVIIYFYFCFHRQLRCNMRVMSISIPTSISTCISISLYPTYCSLSFFLRWRHASPLCHLLFGPRAILRGSRNVKLQLQPKAAATAAKGRRDCGAATAISRHPRQESSLAMDRYCDQTIWHGPHRIPPPARGIHFSLRSAEGSISHTSSSDHKNHTTRSLRVWDKKRLAKLIQSQLAVGFCLTA